MALMRAAPLEESADPAGLAELWTLGLQSGHDAGCGCGGMFAPALSARIIEEDFLDYLVGRYQKEKLSALETFVTLRRGGGGPGAAPPSFERWIASLDGAPLEPAARSRLLADIRIFVESLAGGARRGPGICY